MPRGLIGPVLAMARPARPDAEGRAVRIAARTFCRERSSSAVATDIARQVVADVIAYLDLDLADPLIGALAELDAITEPTPVTVLARCPTIDTAAEILERRLARFRGRGCRQLSAAEWQAETRIVAAEVEHKLALRYARHLRNSFDKPGF